ncbi:MAG: PEP-CTERM sorting domain-containing protein [Planctomycetota bacterium]
MPRRTSHYLAAIATLGLVSTAGAVTVHDESSDGDLSGAFASPTVLTFSEGANTIIGSTGTTGGSGATNGSDADYFTFNLATGLGIDSIVVDSYTSTGNAGDSAFVGHVASNSFTGQAIGDVDSFMLFNNTTPDLFNITPLGDGDQAIWIQQTSNGVWEYQLTFNVIPEPSALGLLLGGAALTAFLRRERLG